MKNTDLKKQYQEAQNTFSELIRDFLSAGIPIPVACIDPALYLSRASTRLGTCRKQGNLYVITLSVHILGDPVTVRNTLAHELVHTCRGCMNHGKTFRRIGNLVEQRLGIRVNRTATEEESERSGIREVYQKKAHFRIHCRKCGNVMYRQKRSQVVIHPERYRCSKCGGTLQVEVL